MDFLKKKREYLAEWLFRFTIAQKEVLPEVQKNLDVTDWEIEALTNLQTTSANIPPKELNLFFERDYKYTIQNIPMMPDFGTIASTTATSIATAGTSRVYDYVVNCGDPSRPDVMIYSHKYTQRYRDLQEAQQRPEQVRQLMMKYASENSLKRFDEAQNAYWSAKSDTSNREKAAVHMRNLLDGIKGDLFQLARLADKENMTWEKMNERLTKGVAMGPEHQELLSQKAFRETLISRLSDVLKDRKAIDANNMEHLWSQVLDHIYTLLGLLKELGDIGGQSFILDKKRSR